jgi:hypothetical protein
VENEKNFNHYSIPSFTSITFLRWKMAHKYEKTREERFWTLCFESSVKK